MGEGMAKLDSQQTLARDTIGTSVIVSASAGAGKTSVLVERLLKRCLKDRVPLDRIAAMTFTKAAAEEMKKRLALGLNDALGKAVPEDKKYISDQLIALSDANITTIDSYCLSLIEKYYNVIGLDPAMTKNILDATTASQLRHLAFRDALEHLKESSFDKAYKICAYFSARSEVYDGLENTILMINEGASSVYDANAYYQEIKNRWHPVRSLQDYDPDIRKAFFADLLTTLTTAEMYLSGMENTADLSDEKYDPQKTAVKHNKLIQCKENLEKQEYRQFQISLESFVLSETSPCTKNEQYSENRKKMEDLSKELLAKSYDESVFVQDTNIISELVSILADLAADTSLRFQVYKKERAAMDFTDMERYVLEILEKNNGEIAEEIKAGYDEIMVDEFQDTSVLQNSIITRIAKADNVFRVGDVKQSIYRFRHAKPELMRSLLQDPSQFHITLQHNYRSKQSIVEFNNMLFSNLMNIQGFKDVYSGDDTVSIGTSAQSEPPVPAVFTSVIPVNETTGDEYSAKDARAMWIAEKILTLHKEGRKFRDIAVLLRAHANKSALRAAFDKYNIPYDIDEREGFYNSHLCMDILSLVKWLCDPEDMISLLAVLESGFYRFTDKDAAELKIGYRSLLEAVKDKHPEIIAEAAELKETAEKKGITAFLREVSKRHDFYNLLDDGEQSNFDFLFQKISANEPENLYAFLTLMSSGTEDRSNEAVVRGKDDDLVTVTTIHQSKGLQYKVVILWSDSEYRQKDRQSSVIMNDDLLLGMRFLDVKTRLKRDTVHYRAVAYMNNCEDLEEFIRLLYVALTRAEERLFIVDVEKGKDMNYGGISRSVVFLRKGMTGLLINGAKKGPLFQIETDSIHGMTPLPAATRTVSSSIPSLTKKLKVLPPVVTPSETEVHKLPPLDIKGKGYGTRYGTRMHSVVENLPNTVWTKEELEDLHLSENEIQSLLAFAESDIYESCLQGEIEKEFDFFVMDENIGQAIKGTFDFVSIKENEVILIDFKTDHAGTDVIHDRYQEQIGLYQRALGILYPGKETHAYAYSFYQKSFITFA